MPECSYEPGGMVEWSDLGVVGKGLSLKASCQRTEVISQKRLECTTGSEGEDGIRSTWPEARIAQGPSRSNFDWGFHKALLKRNNYCWETVPPRRCKHRPISAFGKDDLSCPLYLLSASTSANPAGVTGPLGAWGKLTRNLNSPLKCSKTHSQVPGIRASLWK